MGAKKKARKAAARERDAQLTTLAKYSQVCAGCTHTAAYHPPMNHPALQLAKAFAQLTGGASGIPCCHPVEKRGDDGVIRLVECACTLTREEVIVNARPAKSLDPDGFLSGLKVRDE